MASWKIACLPRLVSRSADQRYLGRLPATCRRWMSARPRQDPRRAGSLAGRTESSRRPGRRLDRAIRQLQDELADPSDRNTAPARWWTRWPDPAGRPAGASGLPAVRKPLSPPGWATATSATTAPAARPGPGPPSRTGASGPELSCISPRRPTVAGYLLEPRALVAGAAGGVDRAGPRLPNERP